MNGKNNMFQQKHLISIFLALFIAASAFLFWQNDRELDPERGQGWWTLSFVAPQDPENLSFTIENHGDQTEFRYEIVADKKTLAEESFTVTKGQSVTITPDVSAQSDTRTSIIVADGKEKKEIYR